MGDLAADEVDTSGWTRQTTTSTAMLYAFVAVGVVGRVTVD